MPGRFAVNRGCKGGEKATAVVVRYLRCEVNGLVLMKREGSVELQIDRGVLGG